MCACAHCQVPQHAAKVGTTCPERSWHRGREMGIGILQPRCDVPCLSAQPPPSHDLPPIPAYPWGQRKPGSVCPSCSFFHTPLCFSVLTPFCVCTVHHDSAPTPFTSSVSLSSLLPSTELLSKMIVLPLLCSRVLFLSLIFITFIYGGGGVRVCVSVHACEWWVGTIQVYWFSFSILCSRE